MTAKGGYFGEFGERLFLEVSSDVPSVGGAFFGSDQPNTCNLTCLDVFLTVSKRFQRNQIAISEVKFSTDNAIVQYGILIRPLGAVLILQEEGICPLVFLLTKDNGGVTECRNLYLHQNAEEFMIPIGLGTEVQCLEFQRIAVCIRERKSTKVAGIVPYSDLNRLILVGCGRIEYRPQTNHTAAYLGSRLTAEVFQTIPSACTFSLRGCALFSNDHRGIGCGRDCVHCQ